MEDVNSIFFYFYVKIINCQKGTNATWNYESETMDVSDVVIGDSCVINFTSGNTISLFDGFYWRIIRTNHDKSIRLIYAGTSPSPTYNCKTQQDAFAVNNSKAKLTYLIGLMTADEIVYAGGVYSTTGGNAWFYRNNKSVSSDYSHSITALNNWWTMTPAVWARDGAKNGSMLIAYPLRGLIAYTNSNNTSGMVVRPVISLSGSLKVASGNGSSSNPYMLSLQTVRVNFHRNRTSSDTSVASQYLILGESGNRFGYFTNGTLRWKQTGQFGQYDYAGHTLQGWALTQNATAKNYGVYSGVNDSWLTNVVNKKYDGQTTAGVIDLYAVWSKN